MDVLDIEINYDRVVIEGYEVKKPPHMSSVSWEEFWANARDYDPNAENDEDLRAELDDVKRDNDDLKLEIEGYESSADDYRAEIRELEETIDELRAKIEELEDKNDE